MTLSRRIIACLDVDAGRVVKGVRFRDLVDAGDPASLAARYARDGADEIVLLDISASKAGRELMLDAVRSTASVLFIPLTVGGGIRTERDIDRAIRAGADKVAVNTAAVERPSLITAGAHRFGSQCIVASIDAAREGRSWRVYTRGGGTRTTLDAVRWAVECAARGAGEILITSIDRDGTGSGYDLELTAAVAAAVRVPVIASGGAGDSKHIRDAFVLGGADAALVAGVLHRSVTSIRALKDHMVRHAIPTRQIA
jgi:cyclase